MKRYLGYFGFVLGILFIGCDNGNDNVSGDATGKSQAENGDFCNCLEEMQNLNLAYEEMDRNSDERRLVKDKIERQKEVCEITSKEFLKQFGNLSDDEKEMKIYMEMINCPFIKEQGQRMMQEVMDATQ